MARVLLTHARMPGLVFGAVADNRSAIASSPFHSLWEASLGVLHKSSVALCAPFEPHLKLASREAGSTSSALTLPAAFRHRLTGIVLFRG